MIASDNNAALIQKLFSLLTEANLQPAVPTENVGACLISTPGTPQPTCAQLTPEQCAAINGVYVGGKCP